MAKPHNMRELNIGDIARKALTPKVILQRILKVFPYGMRKQEVY